MKITSAPASLAALRASRPTTEQTAGTPRAAASPLADVAQQNRSASASTAQSDDAIAALLTASRLAQQRPSAQPGRSVTDQQVRAGYGAN